MAMTKNVVYVLSQGRSRIMVDRTEAFSSLESAKARFDSVLRFKAESKDFNAALYVVRTEPYDPSEATPQGVLNAVTDAVDDMFEGSTLLAMHVVFERERMSGVVPVGDTDVFGFAVPTAPRH